MLNPTKIYHGRIPELRTNYVLASYRSWCVVSHFEYHLFLWNPIALEKVELPQLIEVGDRIGHCILSAPPSHETTRTIMLFTRELPLIIFCRLGDEQWTKLDYRDELRRCKMDSGMRRMSPSPYFFTPFTAMDKCIYAYRREKMVSGC